MGILGKKKKSTSPDDENQQVTTSYQAKIHDIHDNEASVYINSPQFVIHLPGMTIGIPYTMPPVPEYTGHGQKLEDVRKELEKGVVLIYDWGGMGKTEFANKLGASYYQGKSFMLNCTNGVDAALADCCAGAGKAFDERRGAVIEQIRGNFGADTLFVFDNVGKKEDVDLINMYFSQAPCRKLITSRRALGERTIRIPLGALDEAEAVELFKKYHAKGEYTDAENGCITDIVRRSGRHALTLKLLAKTCNAAAIGVDEMLSRMEREGFDIGIAETVEHGGSDEVFIEHMKKLFDITGVLNEDAGFEALFKKLCVLDVTNADKRMLMTWCGESDLNRLNRLAKLGWLRDDKGFTMHNVVSEVLRQKLHPTFEDIESTAQVLKKELEEARDDDKLRYAPQPAQTQTLAMLNAVKENEKLLGDIALMAGLLSYEQGSYEDALWLDDRCVKIYEAVLSNHQGLYENAQCLDERHLKIYEAVLSYDSTELATAYNNIALVYDAKGEYDHALEYHEKALTIDEKVLGREHPDTAISYNNIAEVYRAKGEYDRALEYHEKALAIRDKVLGKEHPDTATSYNNIALVYYAKGEYDHALEYYEKALEIYEIVLGKEHPYTALSCHNIGALFYKMGRLDDAAANLARALGVFLSYGLEEKATSTFGWLYSVYSAKGGDPSDKAAFKKWVDKLISSLD